MRSNVVGIDIVIEFFQKRDIEIEQSNTHYLVKETYGNEEWRFGSYDQLKAFYLGFKYSDHHIEDMV